MKSPTPHRQQFADLIQHGLDESSLARAALLLACEVHPTLDVDASLAVVRELGHKFQARQSQVPDLRARIEALNEVLFEDYGLRGNAEDYYDPRNSLLHEVLSRRVGIPISLSVLYIGVGRAGGLDVRGVGLPGHFIVRVSEGDTRVYTDPFHRGQILTVNDCRRRLQTLHGESAVWRDSFLDVTPPRDILVRMLNNLKSIYLQATDFEQTLWVQDLLLLLQPDDASQYRDRGLVHAQLQRYGDARRDLRSYLERWPGRAPDADLIEQDLERLQRLHQMLN